MRLTIILLAIAIVLAPASAFADNVTDGIFTNPVYQPNGSEYGDGVDTSHFSWGASSRYWRDSFLGGYWVYTKGDDQSYLDYTALPFTSIFDSPIVTGYITLYHGTDYDWMSSINSVDLALTSDMLNPYTLNRSLVNNYEISYETVSLPTSMGSSTFMYDGTEYDVDFLGFFKNGEDGMYQVDMLSAAYGDTDTAYLMAQVSSPSPEVPEAGTLALAASGLGMVGFALRRRK